MTCLIIINQVFLFWITEFVGLLIVVLVLTHIFNFKGGFGGRSFPNLEYNWHVFFMSVGFIFLFGNSLLTFRLLSNLSKPTLKLIHLWLNASVLASALLGTVFIIDMKNLTGRLHFQSLHSWMGLLTLILLIIQFGAGAYVYMSSRAPKPLKESLMPWHIRIGITIFVLGAATMLTVLGHGNSTSERYLKNFIGVFIVIFCFLVIHLLLEQRLKYSVVNKPGGA